MVFKAQKKQKILVLAGILVVAASCSYVGVRETPPEAPAPPPQDAREITSQVPVHEAAPASLVSAEKVADFCAQIDKAAKKMKWNLKPCDPKDWTVSGISVRNRPLMYGRFGKNNSDNITLVLSMVHGDEITPLYLGFKLVEWVKENPGALDGNQVVIAPIVNPDSFFRIPKTRTNARGVDVNRNFDTKDWPGEALKAWRDRFGSNPRRFPGKKAASEAETVFQQELITLVKPQKILSIHAPLNFMDYDGPDYMALSNFPQEYVEKCKELKQRVKARSGGYFPGSLGNWAGQERGIPTLTLELPTADPNRADFYWKSFQTGINTVIHFDVSSDSS